MAGWRAGLAHLRQGALAAAEALPPSLALAAVGAPDSSSWPEIREHLLADPWFDPSAAKGAGNGATGRPRGMAQAGAFRGFGGSFAEPPRVAATGEHFLVCSGEECWLLTADLFGELNSVPAFSRLPVRLAELRRQRRLPACEECHSTHVFEKFVN